MNFAKKLMATLLFASTLIFTGCGQGQVGSVDVEKIMAEAPRVKTLMTEAENKLKEAQEKYQQEYGDKELTEEEATKARLDLQRKLEGINQATITQVKNRMDVVIEEISRQKNIDVVIISSENDKLIFHGAIDITNDVIQKMQ